MISTYARILAVLSALTLAVAAQATHLERATPNEGSFGAPILNVPTSVDAGEDICGTYFGDPPLTIIARYTDSLEEIDIDDDPPSFCLPTSPDDDGRSVVIRVTDGNGHYIERTVLIN